MNKYILDTLSPVNVPVEYQEYTGSETTYVRFFYLPNVDFSADDDEKYITYYPQVDIFTKGNPKNLAKQVKTLMKQAGFKKNFEHEVYEDDTELFHYILRFWITKEEK